MTKDTKSHYDIKFEFRNFEFKDSFAYTSIKEIRNVELKNVSGWIDKLTENKGDPITIIITANRVLDDEEGRKYFESLK